MKNHRSEATKKLSIFIVMKIMVCLCDDFGFQWNRYEHEVELIKGKMSIDGKTFHAVEYCEDFDIERWADYGYNTYFTTEAEGQLYKHDIVYCRANWFLRMRFRWMFKRYWIQKEENLKWTLAAIGGTIVFVTTALIALGIMHN